MQALQKILILISLMTLPLQMVSADPLSPTLMKLVGKNPMTAEGDGPNCWNVVSYSGGFTSAIRFSPDTELTQILTSGFCKSIETENIRNGDFGIMRTAGGAELHAFAIVNAKEGFTKDLGSTKGLPTGYRIEPIEQIIARYHRDMNSKYCEDHQYDEQSPCGSTTQYFRCERPKYESPVAPDIELALMAAEKSLERYYLAKGNCDDCETKVEQSLLYVMNGVSETFPHQVTAQQNTNMWIFSLRLRGVLDNVWQWQFSPDFYKLKYKLKLN